MPDRRRHVVPFLTVAAMTGHRYVGEDSSQPQRGDVMLPVDRPSGSPAGCPARRTGSAPRGRSPARARPGAAERSGADLIQ